MTEIVFEDSAVEFMLDIFDWHDDEFGFIVDENDDLVLDTTGRPIMTHQLGGIVPVGDEDEPTPLRDNFPDIVDYYSPRRGEVRRWDDEVYMNWEDRPNDIREV